MDSVTLAERQMIQAFNFKNGYASFSHIEAEWGDDKETTETIKSLLDKDMIMEYDDCYYFTGKAYDYLEGKL